MKYPPDEHLNKAPPCNPNPPEVDVILIFTFSPQSEHLPFNSIVVFPGLASNSFLSISSINSYLSQFLTLFV